MMSAAEAALQSSKILWNTTDGVLMAPTEIYVAVFRCPMYLLYGYYTESKIKYYGCHCWIEKVLPADQNLTVLFRTF
jgi:hypothetical protein